MGVFVSGVGGNSVLFVWGIEWGVLLIDSRGF